jgi:O-antigen ligase
MNGVAFVLYLVFMCSWFLHLPDRVSILGALRADVLLVGIILLLTVITTGNGDAGTERPTESQTRKWLWVLIVYMLASVPLVEWPGSVLKNGLPQFFKAVVFFFFTAQLTTNKTRLKWLLAVFVLCQTFRVMEPLYLHVTEGYWGSTAHMSDEGELERLAGAPNDVINPNGLAFVALTALPFLHYLSAGSRVRRLGYGIAAPLLLFALVLTASRSGMVGLAGLLGLIWLKSRHKILLMAVVAAAIVFTLPRLSPELADRYLSIVSSKTRNSATAGGRMEGMKANLQVTIRRPLFGHGLGTSREANVHFGPSDQPAHNLYIEVAQELGLCGLAIFLAFLWSVVLSLRRCAATLREATTAPTALRAVVPALQVWIGMNLLFSFASYGLSSYEWYLGAALSEVMQRLLLTAPEAPAAPVAEPVRAAADRFYPVPLRM